MGDRTQQLLLATLTPSTFRNKNMLYLSWVDLYVAINWLVFSLRTTNVPGGLLILPHCGHCQHYHNYPASVSLIQTWRCHPVSPDQQTRCLRLNLAPGTLQCLIVNPLLCCWWPRASLASMNLQLSSTTPRHLQNIFLSLNSMQLLCKKCCK